MPCVDLADRAAGTEAGAAAGVGAAPSDAVATAGLGGRVALGSGLRAGFLSCWGRACGCWPEAANGIPSFFFKSCVTSLQQCAYH